MISSKKLHALSSILFWICIWELFVFVMNDSSVYLSLFTIMKNTAQLVFHTNFLTHHFFRSFARLLVSLTVALPLAYGFALLCIKNKILDSLINTFVSLTFPLPKIALLPLFLLLFGIGDLTKVVLITISVFYLVFINTYTGVRKIYLSEYSDVAQIYKIAGFNYWYQFLIKGSWPYFLTGLKSGLGYGLTMVVVSEYSLSNNGIGYFIWSAWDQFRVADMYSGIFILAVVGYLLSLGCTWLIERSRQ
jgi:ABC-type nitrate/sulfonate/bicarbonate transport system permease component